MIRIERLADSVLTAQTVAGGSLVADTTYYVCVIFQRTSGFREGQACADISNEVNVLTTSVNKSIQLNYSWTVNILSFADDGGGYIRVTTDENHCLLNTNSIDISGTTNYDGTYPVYYDVASIAGTDTPNSFRILHSWDGDDATGTAVCDDNVIGSNNYFSIRCSVEQAYIAGEWDGSIIDNINGWIGPGYSAVAAVQGYTITTQPTLNGNNVVDYMPYFRRSAMPKGVTNYGRPYFQVTGHDSWEDIVAAMETWLPISTNYFKEAAIIGQVETLYFCGHMFFDNLTDTITIQAASIIFDGYMQTNNVGLCQTYLLWNYVNFKHFGVRRPGLCGTFYRSAFRDECGDSPYYYDASWVQTSILPSSNIVFYGTDNAIMDGGSITLPATSRYFWYVYPGDSVPQTRVKNLSIYTGYMYVYWPSYDSSVANDTHYLENLKIYSNEATRDMYLYMTSSAIIIESLNVTAPLQTNGKVRCRRSTVAYGTFRFYFSVDLHVVDSNGNDIVGATVTLTDTLSTEVTDDTDANGNVSLLAFSYQNVVGATVLGDYVDYNPFVLTIEKNGYQQYRQEAGLYDKIEQVIALQPSVEYVEQLLTVDLEEDEIYGVAVLEEVTGAVLDDVIEADVEEDTIYADVEEDTIIGVME